MPPLDKASLPSIATFAICLWHCLWHCRKAGRGLSLLPESPVARALVAVFVRCPVATVLTNSEPLFFGRVGLPGLGLKDMAALMILQFVLLILFLLTRAHLASPAGLRELVWAIALGGLGACHVFAFPSIREFGGGAVLEAMALGVPPLIVDYAGPGELVAEGRGHKVPLGTRSEIVAGFAAALDRLEGERAALAATGQAGRDWVMEHATWAAKARQVRGVYDAVLAGAPLPEVFDGNRAFDGMAHAPGKEERIE